MKTLLIAAVLMAAILSHAQRSTSESAAVHRQPLSVVIAGRIVEQNGVLYLVRESDGKSWVIRNPNRVVAAPGSDVIVTAPNANGNQIRILTMRLGQPVKKEK